MRKRLAIALAALLAAVSCSTTKVLKDGEYRLAFNTVNISNLTPEDTVTPDEIALYIKQQPNPYLLPGWSPSLIIYNWAGRDSREGNIWKKLGTPPVVYNYDLVESSISNIKYHLGYIGYYDSQVESNVSVDGKDVTVSYDVTLGSRLKIDSLVFNLPEGREQFARDFYEDVPNMTIKPGDYLSEKALEDESNRSAKALSSMGYFTLSNSNYTFEADTLSIPGKLILQMNVNEFSRYDAEALDRPLELFSFGKVNVSYPSDFNIRKTVLDKLNTILPGSIYNGSEVSTTYGRMMSMKTFSGVNISLDGVDSTRTVDCNIRLTPAKQQGFKANLEVSSNSSGLFGISPQLTFFDKNLFGGGEWLNVSLMGNRQFMLSDSGIGANELGASASLSVPDFYGIMPGSHRGATLSRTEFNASFNFQNRPEYTRSMASFSVGYVGNISRKLFYQFVPFQISSVRLYNIDSDFAQSLSKNPFMEYAYQSHYDQGVGMMVYHTTAPASSFASEYRYFRMSVDMSGNVLNLLNGILPLNDNGEHMVFGVPYSQYCRAEFNVARARSLGSCSIAGRLVAGIGYAYGNSTSLPFEKQFYVGGANSMRGWQSRALGPGCSKKDNSFSIPSQTGNVKLEADAELRFPLFWLVEGALFAEVGNVWNYPVSATGNPESALSLSTLKDSIAADWGYGLRINLDFLILRLDLGHKVYEPSRDVKWVPFSEWYGKNGFAVHFGVGYPF